MTELKHKSLTRGLSSCMPPSSHTGMCPIRVTGNHPSSGIMVLRWVSSSRACNAVESQFSIGHSGFDWGTRTERVRIT
eukprot:774621-Amphidinium_carterae.1